jgi:hypothetical protein
VKTTTGSSTYLTLASIAVFLYATIGSISEIVNKVLITWLITSNVSFAYEDFVLDVSLYLNILLATAAVYIVISVSKLVHSRIRLGQRRER